MLEPVGLAFDRDGNLWVGGEGSGQLLEYAKSALTRSGSPAPKFDNSAVAPASHVEDVLFDSSGNLWATEGEGGSLVEFKKSQLTNPPARPIADVSSSMPLRSPSGGMSKSGYRRRPAGAAWQRCCRAHFARNLLTRVSKASQGMVATLVRTIFEQPDHDSVWDQHARVVDQLTGRFAEVPAMLAVLSDSQIGDPTG